MITPPELRARIRSGREAVRGQAGKVEMGSGYAVTVGCDENDEAIVDVKAYRVVDLAKHRELATSFPNVKIRNLAQNSSVAVVKKAKRKRGQEA